MLSEQQLAERAADEVANGATVRLGPGLPAPVTERLAPRSTQEQGDVVVLAAEQVSPAGDVVVGDASAAELARAAERVVVVMSHRAPDGAPRLVRHCEGEHVVRGVVSRVLTDLAVIDVGPDGFVVRELAPQVSARDVQRQSEPTLLAGPDLKPIEVRDD